MRRIYPEQRGVIFCRTKNDAETFADIFKGLPFHSGLDEDDRINNAGSFITGGCLLLCATTAFGVGVDIPNIRFSIHAGTPYTLKNFVQEAGRVGRDGLPSSAAIIYRQDDSIDSAVDKKDKDPIFEFLRTQSSCLRSVISLEFDGFPYACFTQKDAVPCQNCAEQGVVVDSTGVLFISISFHLLTNYV
jgi:ATP-dependent DNA helicase RecQ